MVGALRRPSPNAMEGQFLRRLLTTAWHTSGYMPVAMTWGGAPLRPLPTVGAPPPNPTEGVFLDLCCVYKVGFRGGGVIKIIVKYALEHQRLSNLALKSVQPLL